MWWTILHWVGRPWQRGNLQGNHDFRLLEENLTSYSYVCTFRVINVYTKKHQNKKNGTVGKLGDRVLVAVLGQKKKGIIVGMKAKQLHAIPRYDSNNIVLIEDNGNPSGNRITAPLPNVIRPILQKDSNPKKADYTKLFAIATKWI